MRLAAFTAAALAVLGGLGGAAPSGPPSSCCAQPTDDDDGRIMMGKLSHEDRAGAYGLAFGDLEAAVAEFR